jgi:hypothetical protein
VPEPHNAHQKDQTDKSKTDLNTNTSVFNRLIDCDRSEKPDYCTYRAIPRFIPGYGKSARGI